MKRNDIEERASQILHDHKLLDVPVDPLNVAKALGIRVMNAVFSEEGKSGAIVKRGDIFSIFVNANDSPARKRFTIAHEIGHKLLHMSADTDSQFIDTQDNFRTVDIPDEPSWTDERRKEWEANAFASALLMNSELIKGKWQEIKDPSVLAWAFQVDSHPVTKEHFGFRATPFSVALLEALRPSKICMLYTDANTVIRRIQKHPKGRPPISRFEADFHCFTQAALAMGYGIQLGVPVYFYDSGKNVEQAFNQLGKYLG